MDPNVFKRWLTSRVMSRLSQFVYMEARHEAEERKRIKRGAPHRIDYFHQVDDGYSHLVAQVLMQFVQRYEIELHCYLVRAPEGKNIAEPELLPRLSRYDSHLIAPGYGLTFPDHPKAPDPKLVSLATRILATQSDEGFINVAAPVGSALWTGNQAELERLASKYGSASLGKADTVLAFGTGLRRKLKHYSGAMFHYGGEWYWGVDRLYLLEQRLIRFGADQKPGEQMIAPRPTIDLAGQKDNGKFTLEFYASLRSPYTAVIFDRVLAFARAANVKLNLRPVLPMVMRGLPTTREKGVYIFTDAAREARAAGVPYGDFYDPIGDPVRRCYALYPWADSHGKATELFSSFLRHAFVLGVNTNNDRGLRKVVEAAGLDWIEAQAHRCDTEWENLLEENRKNMYAAGLWGVPSFRLLDTEKEGILSVWGQDRLWLVAQILRKALSESRI